MWHGGLGRLIALLCLNGPPAAEHHARSAPKSAEVSSGDKTRRPGETLVPLRIGKPRHIFVTIHNINPLALAPHNRHNRTDPSPATTGRGPGWVRGKMGGWRERRPEGFTEEYYCTTE